MITAAHIAQLENASRTPDTWAERVKRYDAQAAQDHAIYQWLEKRGKLPKPHQGIPPRYVREWQQVQGVKA
jgi:hypothetical protein